MIVQADRPLSFENSACLGGIDSIVPTRPIEFQMVFQLEEEGVLTKMKSRILCHQQNQRLCMLNLDQSGPC
jgi:hypothetical protein